MFGNNKIFKLVREHPGTYEVVEVFKTIQGEGPFTGIPAVFIRMAHCSLACSFCDTEFTVGARTTTTAQLAYDTIELAQSYSCNLVVITGGEPMRQPLAPLIDLLSQAELCVQIETAGIHWEPALEKFIDDGWLAIVCSPKTSRVDDELEPHLQAIKYIVSAAEEADEHDGLPLMAVSQAHNKPTARLWRPTIPQELRTAPIYVQPMDENNEEQNRRNLDRCVELCMTHGYRMSLQTHKILRVP